MLLFNGHVVDFKGIGTLFRKMYPSAFTNETIFAWNQTYNS